MDQKKTFLFKNWILVQIFEPFLIILCTNKILFNFLEFIEGKKIIIHNAEFDIGHLNNELLLINKKPISKENVVDTLEIARNKFPGSGISLDALCKRFRIDNSRRDKHTALIDCELLSKVYINLIEQKEPVFQFKNELKSPSQLTCLIISSISERILSISSNPIWWISSGVSSVVVKYFARYS